MQEFESTPDPGAALVLSLDRLLDALAAEGFARADVRLRLRLQALLNRWSDRDFPEIATLMYQLAALICRSAEEQARFYIFFKQYIEQIRPVSAPEAEQPAPENEPKNTPQAVDTDPASRPENDPPPPAPDPVQPTPTPRAEHKPDQAVAARSGPISIELTLYDDRYRPWNLPELEPVARQLLEKTWSTAETYDVPASIEASVKAGGAPVLIKKRRKRAPQYLFLIEEKSVQDHLAGFFADLVEELRRRDLDAEYYFYDYSPFRCWKDRRNPDTYTSLERLHTQGGAARLLLIGHPEPLLDISDFRPLPQLYALRDAWEHVALLNTRSSSAWDAAEEQLCRLFPVAPASLEGLHSLSAQWADAWSFTPAYWRAAAPEPPAPALPLRAREEAEADVEALLKALQRYLGKQGFNWLCAVAVYPELYWQLTKLLHDEAVSEQEVPEALLRSRVWHFVLSRLSKLEWMRRGRIPARFRERLRAMLAPAAVGPVRNELLRVLALEDNQPPPGSYAYVNKVFTTALLQYERALADAHLAEPERDSVENAFREYVEAEGVALSDIEDAVGRSLWRQIRQKNSRTFRILWADDQPENNRRLAEQMQRSAQAEVLTAVSTEAAWALLQTQRFDLLITDRSREKNPNAALELLSMLRQIPQAPPVVVYAYRGPDHREELMAAGAVLVTNRGAELLEWVEKMARGEVLRPETTTAAAQETTEKLQILRFLEQGDLEAAMDRAQGIFRQENDWALQRGRWIELQESWRKQTIDFEQYLIGVIQLASVIIDEIGGKTPASQSEPLREEQISRINALLDENRVADALILLPDDWEESVLFRFRKKILDNTPNIREEDALVEGNKFVGAIRETIRQVRPTQEGTQVSLDELEILLEQNLEAGLEILAGYGDEGIVLLGRYRTFEENRKRGLLDQKSMDLQRNQLVAAAFRWIQELRNDKLPTEGNDHAASAAAVSQALESGDVDLALQALPARDMDAGILRNRYRRLMQEVHQRSIRQDDWGIRINQIIYALTEWALEKQPDKKIPTMPTASREEVAQLKSWTAENQWDTVLSALQKYSTDALMLRAQYHYIERQYEKGLMDMAFRQRNHARFRQACLDLTNEITAHSRSSWPPDESHQQQLEAAEYMRRSQELEKSGNYLEAMSAAQQALLSYQQTDNLGGQARAQRQIGDLYSVLGNTRQAAKSLEEALRLYQMNSEPLGVNGMQMELGVLYFELNEPEKSARYLRPCNIEENTSAPAALRARAYHARAALAIEDEDYKSAKTDLERAISLSIEETPVSQSADVGNKLEETNQRISEWRRLLQQCQREISSIEQLEISAYKARIAQSLEKSALLPALHLLEYRTQAAEAIILKSQYWTARNQLDNQLIQEQEFNRIQSQIIYQVQTLLDQLPDNNPAPAIPPEAEAARTLADEHRRKAEWPQALRQYELALGHYRNAGVTQDEGLAHTLRYLGIAMGNAARPDYPRAMQYLVDSQKMYAALGQSEVQGQAMLDQLRMTVSTGDLESARVLGETALSLLTLAEAWDAVADAEVELGEIALKTGQYQEAYDAFARAQRQYLSYYHTGTNEFIESRMEAAMQKIREQEAEEKSSTTATETVPEWNAEKRRSYAFLQSVEKALIQTKGRKDDAAQLLGEDAQWLWESVSRETQNFPEFFNESLFPEILNSYPLHNPVLHKNPYDTSVNKVLLLYTEFDDLSAQKIRKNLEELESIIIIGTPDIRGDIAFFNLPNNDLGAFNIIIPILSNFYLKSPLIGFKSDLLKHHAPSQGRMVIPILLDPQTANDELATMTTRQPADGSAFFGGPNEQENLNNLRDTIVKFLFGQNEKTSAIPKTQLRKKK